MVAGPVSTCRSSSPDIPVHLDSFVDSLIFRIDGNYYDLTDFSTSHPGGRDILVWAKRKAWDHTQMFATHHVNYTRAAAMMKRFLITNPDLIERIQTLEAAEVPTRFPRQLPVPTSKHYPKKLSNITAKYRRLPNEDELPSTSDYTMADLHMADCTFELAKKGSFYWELRQETHKYFKAHQMNYTPTNVYWVVFYLTTAAMFISQFAQYHYKSYTLALFTGFLQGVLGGFGHQFIHNPVRFRNYAYVCLDWVGLWSYQFMVDHIAIHHIYTNTIPDNHFVGTDPFVLVNPLESRKIWKRTIQKLALAIGFGLQFVHYAIFREIWISSFSLWFPIFAVVFEFETVYKMCVTAMAVISCSMGIFGNYAHCVGCILSGSDPFTWSIFLFPMNVCLQCVIVGDFWLGLKLSATSTALLGLWYFSIALSNHNQEENWAMERLVSAGKRSWAEMQLVTSTDIGYDYGFVGSLLCLWLNYHTVHHLLPTVDMSHHQEAQKILRRVARKHGLEYSYKGWWTMYWSMIDTFAVARALKAIVTMDV